MRPLAALPLYDWPEIRDATDGLWAALVTRLRAAGLEAPEALDRARDSRALWTDPALLLSQADPFAHVAGDASATRIICAPVYEAEGCGAGKVAAVILARRDGPEELGDIAGAPIAVASAQSLHGRPALLDALGPEAVGPTIAAGSARAAIRAVAAGEAQAACVDALSWALAQEHEPEAAALAPLGWTDPLPAPPFVTSALTETGARARIRAAIVETLVDPQSESLRRALRLARIVALADPDYDPARRLARLAAQD